VKAKQGTGGEDTEAARAVALQTSSLEGCLRDAAAIRDA